MSAASLLTAATLGEQTVLDVSEYLLTERFKAASSEKGAQQAQVCRACHSLEEGGPNMIGPALFSFFGRSAGQGDGFAYSTVLSSAEFVWTPRALDAWLAQPALFLPGNRMTFGGVLVQRDRDDLIKYLLETTANPGSE